jgi:Cof subfamily protein (haloacid dehalogenase superfamily)
MEKPDIKLIAFDLDGTAIDDNGRLSYANRDAIVHAATRGVYMVPCTGRSKAELPQQIVEIDCIQYILTSNGAMIYHGEEVIFANYMDAALVQTILCVLENVDALVELYIDGRPHVSYSLQGTRTYLRSFRIPTHNVDFYLSSRKRVDDIGICFQNHSHRIEKINAFLKKDEDAEFIIGNLADNIEHLEVASSMHNNIEFTEKGTNKGAGLAALCAHLEIGRENVVAIGDSLNDVAMFEYAGLYFAPENALAGLKEKAAAVVADNNHSSIQAMCMHLLSNK